MHLRCVTKSLEVSIVDNGAAILAPNELLFDISLTLLFTPFIFTTFPAAATPHSKLLQPPSAGLQRQNQPKK